MTPEMIGAALRQMLDLIDEKLPQNFYRGEGLARPVLLGLVARIGGIGKSMLALLAVRRQADTLILLRALYEHVLTLCWLAIEPDRHVQAWRDHAVVHRKRLHNDALAFGVELMEQSQLDEAAELSEIVQLQQRAEAVDRFWSERIRGFRSATTLTGQKQILSFRGLYTGIYRPASRLAHAQIETIDDCVDFSRYPRYPAVVHAEKDDDLTWSALAVPLISMALLVCNYVFHWPDETAVREMNDALMRDSEAKAP